MLQPNTQTIYSITLNSLPSSGIIAFNGTQYQSGNTVQVAAGNYPINAIPPANFIFSSWMFANTIYITNAGNQNTIATISGNGTITANFFGNVIFIEKGLPANTVWSVDIDGITMNALSPSSIVFQPMPPGAYIFAVANQTISNTLYIASPSNGNVVAGNTTSITFSPTTTSKTSPASTTIPANTIYYSLAFNSVPSAGIISFNGIGYQNGNAIQVAPGNYPINAIAPANFIFSSWISTNSVNLTFANPYSANTNLAVSGSGVVAAIFNGITTFSENGLPSGTEWNVTYDGILNSSTTNTITFSTQPGNYLFTVANQIVSNAIYFPMPNSGNVVAGNTTSISFVSTLTSTNTIAMHNLTATFTENGLPANIQWSVTYNGVTQNAIAPNSIAFSTSPGNYTFTIENAIASNSIYLPAPQNGFTVAGNSTTIYFTPQKTNFSTS
ncbi:MAG: hypothetical protein QXZ38_04170, partial [Candidatus Micrarchaeaceae archaeon]